MAETAGRSMAKGPLHICTVTADPALAEIWRDAIAPLAGSHTAFDGLLTGLRRLPEHAPDIILIDRSASDINDDQLALKIRHRSPSSDLLLAGDAVDLTRQSAVSVSHWNVLTIPRDCE